MRKAFYAMTLTLASAFGLSLGLLPQTAHAWWQDDYQQRTKVIFNTSSAGVETKEALTNVLVPVRLHSGNFDFLAAKPDGSDLRVLAADDKTALKFWIERYDATNELALVWVQVPTLVPGSDKNLLYVYAGNEKAQPEATTANLDAATLAAIHFAEKDGPAHALGAAGDVLSSSAVTREKNGLLANSARLTGQALSWPAEAKLQAPGTGPYSVSLWARPDGAASGTLYEQGPIVLSLQAGKVVAQLGSQQLTGGEAQPTAWAHVVLTVGNNQATLYLNGVQVAQAALAANAPALAGEIHTGAGFNGQIDEVQIAATLRSADWVKVSHAAQSADAKLVAYKGETKDNAEQSQEEAGYFGILIKNLTPDAIAVIAILAVMFAIAVYVMIDKAILVGRMDRHNRQFIERFRENHNQILTLKEEDGYPHSSIFRLYQIGVNELNKRAVNDTTHQQPPLSGASIDAVRAAIDADLVRENHRLNAKMVLLTIAISGGPFLGLLGTVVGVMITFAAIAAAGDVNVNAIAPGIAAALLATVAGLGVAIPALFGYNYLAARIKNISADMQIFADEFITRVAEKYGAR